MMGGKESILMGVFGSLLAANGGADLWGSIANVGFPIAVATYLLLKLAPKLEDLTTAVKDLTTQITLLKEFHATEEEE